MPRNGETSYGQQGNTIVDRFGVYLSKRAILRHLPSGNDLSVLDIGCGYHAVLLRSLLPRMRQGFATDFRISDDVARIPQLTTKEGSVEDVLPGIADGQFDVVLFTSVLEHLWEPLKALGHCHRVLRAGGTLFLNVPTWRGKFFLEYSAFTLGTSPALEMDDHKMYYDKKDLWPLLVRSGFAPSNIRLQYHKFGLNLFAVARKSKALAAA